MPSKTISQPWPLENITIAVSCKDEIKIFIREGAFGDKKKLVCLDPADITSRFTHDIEEVMHGVRDYFMLRGGGENGTPIYFEGVSNSRWTPLHAFSLIVGGHRHQEKYATPWAEIRFTKEALEEFGKLRAWILNAVKECKTLKSRIESEAKEKKRPTIFPAHKKYAVIDQVSPLPQIHISVSYFHKRFWIWLREGDFESNIKLFFPAEALLNFLNNPSPKEGLVWRASSCDGGIQGEIVMVESKSEHMKMFCLQSSKTNISVRMSAETFAAFFSLRPWLCEVIDNQIAENDIGKENNFPLYSELHTNSARVISQGDDLDPITVCTITLPSDEQVIFVRQGIEDFKRTYFGALADFRDSFQTYFSKKQKPASSNLFLRPEGKKFYQINQTEESAIRFTDIVVKELRDCLRSPLKKRPAKRKVEVIPGGSPPPKGIETAPFTHHPRPPSEGIDYAGTLHDYFLPTPSTAPESDFSLLSQTQEIPYSQKGMMYDFEPLVNDSTNWPHGL